MSFAKRKVRPINSNVVFLMENLEYYADKLKQIETAVKYDGLPRYIGAAQYKSVRARYRSKYNRLKRMPGVRDEGYRLVFEGNQILKK